jgi:endoglucanase
MIPIRGDVRFARVALLGIALGAWMAVVSVAADASAQPVSDVRFAQLERGINLSHWFAQVLGASGYTREHLLGHTTVEDVALIKRLGFRHVRLSVDPSPMVNPDSAGIVRGDHLAQLERAIKMLIAQDLAVIVDVHPSSDFKKALERDDRQVDRFVEFWYDLARQFSGLDDERLFFEVLNEPEFVDGYRWSGVQAKLVATIRQAAAKHTVIVTGRRWSTVDDLLALAPVADENVIYNFHFYAPHVFTHQGAVWGSTFWRYLSKVPYPSTPENVASVAGTLPDHLPRLWLLRYGHERWSAARIAMEIEQVAAWASKHNVRVTCNEFGVYRALADPGDRAKWISDVRVALERHRIGWTMWDYAGDFGLVSGQPGSRVVDASVLSALGLDRQARPSD